MHENTEITLTRDVDAIQIPSGNTLTLTTGTVVVITQSLGGSYTVATENLGDGPGALECLRCPRLSPNPRYVAPDVLGTHDQQVIR